MWRTVFGLSAALVLASACAGVQEQETTASGSADVGAEEQVSETGNGTADGGNTNAGAGDSQGAPTEGVESEDVAGDGSGDGAADDGADGAAGDDSAGMMASEAEPGTQLDFVESVQDRVFFAFDRSSLNQQARETLRAQAEWLRSYTDVRIRIEGHTDERGTREYNMALGERRATAVRDYLVAQGISPDRIDIVSYGKERPAVEGSNEAAWAQNRRAVTVVVEPSTGS